ncbi:hypothetical protein GCM10009836_25050 [Pseudonocardia ailaonensis]|uniref:Uncharacterized protein n=1 Tax=Pseudonocardia ailaonensis TaxID=367279 RepID=A0ABN2MZJ5_9PSEU
MNYAHRAASWVMGKGSHEALIAAFVSLIVVISVWEGGVTGLLVTVIMGAVGGLMSRALGFGVGVQFMCYYTSVLTVPALLALAG